MIWDGKCVRIDEVRYDSEGPGSNLFLQLHVGITIISVI